MEPGATVENVCKFLEGRGVESTTTDVLRKNKMDGDAINASTDETLRSLGLTAIGDVIALRSYLKRMEFEKESPNREMLKEELAAAVRQGYSNGKSNSSKKKFTVTAGLQNYNEKLKKYTYVKSTGGSRKFMFPRNANMESIKKELHDVYFPDGKNPILGRLYLHETYVGSFSGEKLHSDTTLEQYYQNNKLKHIRLYLKTKKKGLQSFLKIITDSESDDDFLELPAFREQHTNDSFAEDLQAHRATNASSENVIESPLIGSSAERKRLRNEIDRAYNESLEADKKKSVENDFNRELEEQENQRLIDLMKLRREQVMLEPQLTEPHVTISIRHPIVGNKTRLFHDNLKFTQVYDWVGGLSDRPEHFVLLQFDCKSVLPDENVYSVIFNVNETDTAIPMTPEGTVAFRGFGTVSSPNDDESSKKEDAKIDLTSVLKEDDGENEDFDTLQILRKVESSKLNDTSLFFEISRDDIYNDLINIYKKRGIAAHKVQLTFADEPAAGDGVTKDCYAEFYERLFEKMEGVVEKVPLDNSIDEEELEVVGSIINHAFLQFSIFPLQLCRSTLKKVLFDVTDKQQLLSSFMNFITPAEAEMILRFTKGESTNDQALSDILHSCKVYEKPTSQNALQLCLKAANTVLINRPYLSMKGIVKGMGQFWQKLLPNMVDALYLTCMPQQESLIGQLSPNETCAQDQVVTTYLHRNIRSCTKSELLLFVRFITGSSTILPNEVIKVEFVDQPVKHLHPLTQTCFQILILPRQFRSFAQFQSILNIHFSSQEHWSVYDKFIATDI